MVETSIRLNGKVAPLRRIHHAQTRNHKKHFDLKCTCPEIEGEEH